MTPETKEMIEATQSKSIETTQIGPVVAIQYPEKWEYSENEESAGVIAQKYAHFKTLGPDDTDGYKELVLAIADVRTRRTDVAKQEKVIKDPLNRFRDVVIKTSKSIRGLLGKTEDDLKGIKTRIDDIKLERKLALQKFWQDNISGLTSILQTMGVMDASQLIELLESQSTYVFKPDDFGEFIDQAKSAVAQNVIAITERIDFLAEQKRLADEKTAFDKKVMEEAAERKRLDDKRKVREAADQKLRDDEKALSDQKTADDAAEMQRMRDKIAAMEKEAEPVPEIAAQPQGEVTQDLDVVTYRDDARKEPKQTPETFSENLGDINELNAWAKEIEKAKELGPVPGMYTETATDAVNAVYDQLQHLIDYLKATAEELK
jgi:septal ring factor EnvC (AmiA/AmiB activator)